MANDSIELLKEKETTRGLSVPADEGQLSRVRDFISEVCDEAGFSTRETNNTKLAVDEACTNIIKHAYDDRFGEIVIRAQISPGKVEISLFDTGKAFNFGGIQDPDLDQYVESGRKGGLGIFLINRLMDGVEYRTAETGNELHLVKRSHAAAVRSLHGEIGWRSSLRYKLTLRASLGLFVLIAAIWGSTFYRQSGTMKEQLTTQWLEKRRLAENLANKSKELLVKPEAFSIEQTNLTAVVTKLLDGDQELAYVRVVDSNGKILSSGNIDEMFTDFVAPKAQVLLEDDQHVTWTRFREGRRFIRNIKYSVTARSEHTGKPIDLGSVQLGVYEDSLEKNIHDPRFGTTMLIVAIFLVGILLIMLLVSVFVKPIQVLTDGVRAIRQGTLNGKISVDGPAEIGAIAAVFNEITEKFKKAQESVLEQEKLHKEMEVAKQIQQSLLPRAAPDISGYDIAPLYHAAKEVGGDYYDFVQVDDDTIGVVVADVSGKGVPGSLVMTMIRTALRMEARGNKNASDVMAKMNDFVTDDMKKGMFVTMFYVILDSKNRVINYSSAGHNPMILYRAESNETFFLNPKGFPVGISLPDESLFRRAISLEKIKLKKDDMLVIYTDGVTEAMNDRRDQYGEDRLIRVIKEYGHLHPKEFITKLEQDIKRFTGGHPQNDDITVVAVKEKLMADDVLFDIRKKLIELVEVGGLGVKEACARMKVSPATYYRYKKRLEVMGERGLKNKVLRQDVDLKRLSIEERKEILEIIKQHPTYGAKRITVAYNRPRDPAAHVTERMVYDELRRLNLNTKDLRLDYLRRNNLIDEERFRELSGEGDKDTVDSFLEDISTALVPFDPNTAMLDVPAAATGESGGIRKGDEIAPDQIEIEITRRGDDISVLHVRGHLDSATSPALDEKLKELIEASCTKFVVDLSRVSYVSSGGWGIFTGEIKRLRERGGDVVLAEMVPEVYDVYELLGFTDVVDAFAKIDDACQFLRKSSTERAAHDVLERRLSLPTEDAQGDTVPAGAVDEESGSDWESLEIEATTVGPDGAIAAIALRGVIDTISAENLREVIDKVMSSGIYNIVVDMSLVEYVSSNGWGTFTERLREIRRKGGDVKLFGMDPDVHYVFTMLGFNLVLSSFDVMSEAIEDFDGEGREEVRVANNASAMRRRESPAARPDVGAPKAGPTADINIDPAGIDDVAGLESDASAARASGTRRRRRVRGEPSNEDAVEAGAVDVDSATADERIVEDAPLGGLGWEKYGEALKEKMRRKIKSRKRGS